MSLDLSDIQGLVFHAYRRHPFARYVLLRFVDGATDASLKWLRALVSSGRIDSATPKEAGSDDRPAIRLNIAFTNSGLRALGLDDDTLSTFAPAFLEGLGVQWAQPNAPDHRSRILGDVNENEPTRWDWGLQQSDKQVDALLLAFGIDAHAVDEEIGRWIESARDLGAARLVRVLQGEFPLDPSEPVREPFGFVDGISQPVLRGAHGLLRLGNRRTQPEAHTLEDGEILLGYRDGARQLSASPTVVVGRTGTTPPLEYMLPRLIAADAKPDDDRAPLNQAPERRDLGRNGTYLVFRQLAQNVEAFDDACKKESAETGLPVNRVKARIVGRWPGGSPLVTCPISPDRFHNGPPAANDFTYASDPLGERCPIGAHIRRANPRDALLDDRRESLRISNRHRILRRGRPYSHNGERGIHFIAFNADFVRQFEFIQQNWINDSTFGGLDDQVDRLIGVPPRRPVAPGERVAPLATFVSVKGGGYFFLPGLTALRYLARDQPREPQSATWQPVPYPPRVVDVVRFLSLTRFSLLLAAVLALAPLSRLFRNGALNALVDPMFEMGAYWELAVVTMMASLTASAAMITWRIVQLYSRARFGIRTGWSEALTWWRVLRWQALSLPWVATAVWLSAPVTEYSRRHLPGPFVLWTLAAVAGYASAFALMCFAEVLRQRGVRKENPEDTVILPPSIRFARLKGSPGVADLPLLKPLVAFIERRTATWPDNKGKGYIDHRTGSILPGHLSVLALMAVAAILYAAGRFVFHPNGPFAAGFQLPPAAYLLFLLFGAGWAMTSAAFCLDRYRVPLLTLIVAWSVISSTFPDADHRFPVVHAGGRGTWHAGPTIADAIRSADLHANRPPGADKDPLIVVAAGGGGAYQAAWVARVLTGLTDVWGSTFSRNVRMVSAVSAGAVGSMHFLNQYSHLGSPESSNPTLVDRAGAPATGDVWWGFTYFDVPRMLTPLRIARDRGWALEQAWLRAMDVAAGVPPPTMTDWQRGVGGGWRPAIAFNAMAVESGERVVLATYSLPESAPAKTLGQITNNHDMAVVTAARLAAAFPYVTPFARSDGEHAAKLHIADGGFWDNHAVVSALEWLHAAASELDGRDVILIKIPPPGGGVATGRNQSWVWQFPAPLMALESVRTNAQRARNDLDLQSYARDFHARQMAKPAAERKTFLAVEFSSGGDESLSWHVSGDERCRIERRWDAYLTRRTEIARLAASLGQPRPTSAATATTCRP